MTRRFIAGAVCPRCGLMDKLLVDTETEVRECVSCGFSEPRPKDPVTELATRVNRPAARLVETRAESIRLVESEPESTGNPDQEDVD